MNYYLSGGITGVKNYKQRFLEAEAIALKNLKECTPIIFNPGTDSFYRMIQRYCKKQNLTWSDCMKECTKTLALCDAIVMLPRWYLSRGAWLEYLLARFVFRQTLGYIKKGKLKWKK